MDIQAPPERVWKEVIHLGNLPPTHDWVLLSGVACPQRTEIVGHGVGARRNCTLSTGPMPEVITNWQPSVRLGFVPRSTPPMMKELNPFRETRPPHLTGYYRVLYGEFSLQPLPGNRTRLFRKTVYEHRFRPALYWNLITNLAANHAHAYVLEHVKRMSESSLVANR